MIDGQGPARGPDPGPVRLRPFPPDAIAGVAILKLNRLEAEAAAGGRLDRDALLGLGAPEVVVTMGADGVLVADPYGLWEIPGTGGGGYDDPTGAGDSFSAAYVLARSRGAARRPPRTRRERAPISSICRHRTQARRRRVLFATCSPTGSAS